MKYKSVGKTCKFITSYNLEREKMPLLINERNIHIFQKQLEKFGNYLEKFGK